ncbi:MAG: hypothetical protein KGO96_13715 [Elusimicrobia bacterium]|nr:hypothetical protein [Elusimicrobiota bacterium]MDE2236254.1 hypothetical protein [Elusimicrobiota bacterium]MDE2426952.1 hypothetical protein [Elusimicrobiota bacterium]
MPENNDGRGGWGYAMLGESGIEYEASLGLIERPDWLLWLVETVEGKAGLAPLLTRAALGDSAAPEGWEMLDARELGDKSFGFLVVGDLTRGFAWQFHAFRLAYAASGLRINAESAVNAIVKSEAGTDNLWDTKAKAAASALCERMRAAREKARR